MLSILLFSSKRTSVCVSQRCLSGYSALARAFHCYWFQSRFIFIFIVILFLIFLFFICIKYKLSTHWRYELSTPTVLNWLCAISTGAAYSIFTIYATAFTLTSFLHASIYFSLTNSKIFDLNLIQNDYDTFTAGPPCNWQQSLLHFTFIYFFFVHFIFTCMSACVCILW